MKLKFLITSLTSCSGCISSLISLDIFPQLLERTEISYFPFISDKPRADLCDIALIEGCVSEDSQIDFLKDIRISTKKVYALGTCAAFGGILSLSKKKIAAPLSDFIEIDGIIPGCPPPSKLFGNCLIKLLERKNIELSKKNLCSECPYKTTFKFNPITQINQLYPHNIELNNYEENTNCFLSRGIMCLGPITREGCDHECIKRGIPCEGCLGPVSRDFTSSIINFLSLLNLVKDLKKYSGIFYRFSKPKIWRR
ncbi:MAG: hypothetical protein ACFFBP_11440 [Promethearchaeota archaeon]